MVRRTWIAIPVLAVGVLLTPPAGAQDTRGAQASLDELLQAEGMTQEEMAVELLRALDGAEVEPPDCVPGQEMFEDVPASSPFCPFIEELARRGITEGCDDDNFCPSDTVTRSQMATFIVRALEASHDHLVQQATGGGVFATEDQTTIRSMTFSIPDECNLIFTETHNVVVDISGYVENGGPSGSLVETDIELWIDGSPISTASTEIEFEAPTAFETEAFAKRRLVELSSGIHTIEVVADAESSNLDYIVDADMVVERLGWTCTLNVPSNGEADES